MELSSELVPLFRGVLELSKVKEGEIVAVLTHPGSRPEYVAAGSAAAASLGAEIFEISVPQLGWARQEERTRNMVRYNMPSVPALLEPSLLLPAVRNALLESDLILDLLPETIMLFQFREELQAEGKRILTVTEPPDVLERLYPSLEIKESVIAMGEEITAANELRVTSPAGTDLTYDITGVRGLIQYGFADEPGRWDNFPSALANVWPIDGSCQGVQVLQPGDIIFPFKQYIHEAITMKVEDGYIRSIEGGFEAQLLRSYLESWEDPEVYALAHASVGMHPKAQWSALPFYERDEYTGTEARSIRGAVLFTTGPNRFVDRMVQPHYDMCCMDHSAYLDGNAVVEDGRVVLGEKVA